MTSNWRSCSPGYLSVYYEKETPRRYRKGHIRVFFEMPFTLSSFISVWHLRQYLFRSQKYIGSGCNTECLSHSAPPKRNAGWFAHLCISSIISSYLIYIHGEGPWRLISTLHLGLLCGVLFPLQKHLLLTAWEFSLLEVSGVSYISSQDSLYTCFVISYMCSRKLSDFQACQISRHSSAFKEHAPYQRA